MRVKTASLLKAGAAFCLIITAALSMCGCGGGNDGGVSRGLLMATDSANGMTYSTDDGIYEINETVNEQKDGTTFSSLTYVDYESGKQVYLCDKPNCKHDSYDCSAVLPEEATMGNTNALFSDGKSLYILSTPPDDAGSTMTGWVDPEYGSMLGGVETNQAPVVYRMDMDGSNREKLYTFEEGQVAENTVLQDGKDFYFITKKLETEDLDENTQYTTGYDRQLVKINLDKGKQETIAKLDNDTEILGACHEKIITGETVFQKELSPEEMLDDSTFNAEFKKSTYKICQLDVKTGESKEIKTMKQNKDNSTIVKNGCLYISHEGKKTIDIYDISSEDWRKIETKESYRIETTVDETLICTEWVSNDNYYAYYVNSETGETTKSTLQTRYGNPYVIQGQTSENVFVLYDYKTKQEYVPWMDLTQEVNDKVYYGTMSKEDFLANNNNINKIKMLEDK